MIEITYKLKFKSDFHIGSGSGIPGIIDNGMKYDCDGIPEIQGKTIKGILRDAIENLMHVNKDTQDMIKIIFGNEGGDITCYRFSTLSIETKHKNKITGNRDIQKGISHTQSHNFINRETLVAKEGALFFCETAPHFLEYSGDISQIKYIDKDIEDKVLFYLVCGLRFVTHIGGKRRRGNGMVRFEIEEIKKDANVLDWKDIIEKGINGIQ